MTAWRVTIGQSDLEQQVHIWPVDLQAPESAVEQAESLLPQVERERALRYLNRGSRNRFSLSRSFLRKLLSHFLGIPGDHVELAYEKDGKPKLAGKVWPHRFSLSHAGRMAVVAISAGCEVGVDIEPIRRIDEINLIVERFFSFEELRAFGEISEESRIVAFLRAWTREEAYVKGCGTGISLPLSSFSVPMSPQSIGPFPVRTGHSDGVEWRVQDFSPGESYVGAVAYSNARRRVVVHECRNVTETLAV